MLPKRNGTQHEEKTTEGRARSKKVDGGVGSCVLRDVHERPQGLLFLGDRNGQREQGRECHQETHPTQCGRCIDGDGQTWRWSLGGESAVQWRLQSCVHRSSMNCSDVPGPGALRHSEVKTED